MVREHGRPKRTRTRVYMVKVKRYRTSSGYVKSGTTRTVTDRRWSRIFVQSLTKSLPDTKRRHLTSQNVVLGFTKDNRERSPRCLTERGSVCEDSRLSRKTSTPGSPFRRSRLQTRTMARDRTIISIVGKYSGLSWKSETTLSLVLLIVSGPVLIFRYNNRQGTLTFDGD